MWHPDDALVEFVLHFDQIVVEGIAFAFLLVRKQLLKYLELLFTVFTPPMGESFVLNQSIRVLRVFAASKALQLVTLPTNMLPECMSARESLIT